MSHIQIGLKGFVFFELSDPEFYPDLFALEDLTQQKSPSLL